jgi:hypothetical protein
MRKIDPQQAVARHVRAGEPAFTTRTFGTWATGGGGESLERDACFSCCAAQNSMKSST